MNQIILLICALSLIGCSDESKNMTQSVNKIERPDKSITSTQKQESNAFESSAALTPEKAKEFAVSLVEKIKEDEKFILDAFELKETEMLGQYFYDIQSFMFPYSNEPTKSYWPDSNLLDPYIKCDTALRDLQIYSNALFHQLRSDTPTSRKIVRQEKEDFENSKMECTERANMTYDEAMKTYEEE